MKIFKRHKKVYQIHPKIQEWICKFIVWKDDLGVCYIDTQIYNTCKQCPYEVIK
jgi:hypothetical protein